ncbi:MAG: hypothetical protein N3A38_13270 [Planctomycetota bacterium]|nr:hypothetical protein [Planctomycetota bacterium]
MTGAAGAPAGCLGAGAVASLLLALLLAPGGIVSAAGAPEHIAIAVNADSWVSRAIANEYAALRGIPPSNVILLPGPPSFECVTAEDFRRHILLPLLKAMRDRGIAGQIDCIAYSADFPTAVDVSGDAGPRKLPPIFGRKVSINGLTYFYLSAIAGDVSCLDLYANRYARRIAGQPRDGPWTAGEQALYAEALRLMGAREDARDGTGKGAEPDRAPRIERALKALKDLAQKHPASANLHYNIACCLAMLDRPGEALASLRKAVSLGWRDADHAARDADLECLRGRREFEELLAEMRSPGFEVQPSRGFRASIAWDERGEPDASPKGPRYMLSMMLACTSGRGNSVAEAISCLRRSVAADFSAPRGTVYFMENSDVRSSTRHWAFPRAAQRLRELGVAAEILKGILPPSKPDVAGAVIGASNFSWKDSGSRILPGAIVEHMTSFGGAMEEDATQTPLSELLRYGAAGASGTVAEPFAILEKFPFPFIHVHYAGGCTLAEAFYLSVPSPCQLLMVGDPMCRPWGKRIAVEISGIRPGDTVSGAVEVSVAAKAGGGAGISEIEFFLDGVRLGAAGPDGRFALDSRRFMDGFHELSAVVTAADAAMSRGRSSVPAFFRNQGRSVAIRRPREGRVDWDSALELLAEAPGARYISIRSFGCEVARVDGGSGRVAIDPRSLGPGPVRLDAVAFFGPDGLDSAVAEPVYVEIVPPPPLPPTLAPADSSGPSGGFLVKTPDGRQTAVRNASEGWLEKAGIRPGDRFEIEALFCAAGDGLHQLQVRARAVEVEAIFADGRRLNPLAGGGWKFLPLNLAAGPHSLRVVCRAVGETGHGSAGNGGDRSRRQGEPEASGGGSGNVMATGKPDLDIRFGLRGTRRMIGPPSGRAPQAR